jgi:hypothetical protein
MTETASGDTMALMYMEPYLKRLKSPSTLYIELFKKHFCEDFTSSYMDAIKALEKEPLSSYENLWLSFAKSAYTSAIYHAEREEENA